MNVKLFVGRPRSNLHKEELRTFEKNLGRTMPQNLKRATSNDIQPVQC